MSVSATASVLAMALFALVVSLGGISGTSPGNGQMASPLVATTN